MLEVGVGGEVRVMDEVGLAPEVAQIVVESARAGIGTVEDRLDAVQSVGLVVEGLSAWRAGRASQSRSLSGTSSVSRFAPRSTAMAS